MPVEKSTHSPLQLRIIASLQILIQRAQYMDYSFMQAVVCEPEFNGSFQGAGTPISAQKVILTVTANTVLLIKLICTYLRHNADMLPQNGNTLVITGPDPTPVQICDGQFADRHDFRTTHEEADVVIIQQAVHLATTGINSIREVADDPDVFVLLLYYYTTQQLTCNLVMTGTSYGRTSDDTKATVEKHSDIIPYMLTAHVLSGCDTVAYLWGIGKVTAVKV